MWYWLLLLKPSEHSVCQKFVRTTGNWSAHRFLQNCLRVKLRPCYLSKVFFELRDIRSVIKMLLGVSSRVLLSFYIVRGRLFGLRSHVFVVFTCKINLKGFFWTGKILPFLASVSFDFSLGLLQQTNILILETQGANINFLTLLGHHLRGRINWRSSRTVFLIPLQK